MNLHVCRCVYMYCMNACMYICRYDSMYVCIYYMYIHVWMYVCMYRLCTYLAMRDNVRQVTEELLCSVFPILEFHHEGAKLQIPGCKNIHTHRNRGLSIVSF